MLCCRRRRHAFRVRPPCNHSSLIVLLTLIHKYRANLSEQYFTDRQDRYYWFKNNAALSGFYSNLLHVIESLSFGIDPAPNGIKHAETRLSLPAGVPDPSVEPRLYKSFFKTKLDTFWSSFMTKQSPTLQLTSQNDTVVFPTCQVGPCDFTNDHEVVDATLAMVPSTEALHITTPYCNFTDSFTNIMFKQCQAQQINVIVAHPTANGFFKGKGAHTLIPWAYSSFLERFHALVASAGQMARVHLVEYERPDWTFHAKGLWFEFPKSQSESIATGVSVVGSSNFGFRSAQRDLEAQALVVTQNENLVASMRRERNYIFKTGSEVSEATFADRKKHTPWWLPFIMFFAKRFM
jgi:CDP-diacylglycerol---glycerol-3-phosphate 3-phosphatidyltransferase